MEAGAAMLSVTDKSRIGSGDQQRYTVSLAEATEFGCAPIKGSASHRVHKVELRYDAEG